MRALVVDDSKPSRSIVARALRELRFECDEAANGAEAIERLAAGPRPDLVTVNWHMPVMDGIELLRRLRGHPRHRDLKLLMISTESDRGRIEMALAAGADDFVSKPFTAEALARKLVGLGVCSATEVGAAADRGPIRVLLVDDSATIRSLLSATLTADPDLAIAGAAVNGRMAVEMVAAAPPDIVLLDVEMPVLDGIAALREIRRLQPRLPVIMFSSLTERGAKATLDALLAGANDYASKPAGLEADAVATVIRDELVAKIKALVPRRRRFERSAAPTPHARRPPPLAGGPVRAVVIAVSTGGPTALAEVLPACGADLGVPVLIVQHMPAFFTAQLAERLSRICGRPVHEAQEGRAIAGNDILLAPGGRHLAVAGDGGSARVRLTDEPPENSCRPSADVLFRSAATVWRAGVLGVVLTGMGRDGLAGARAIVEAGGAVIAQDEFSSVVWGMPGEVVRAGLADAVLPLGQIGPEVTLRVARRGR
ncbi:MAG: chemotaxis-specific protein-glutamate methyltransferase CheB [Planctomycetia bacterium]|nr:chemotaxis-specific protein-glutamate methyltransferase CheB [Planctomycetia bacterium]